VSRPISAKPDTCPDRCNVYPTDIGVKVDGHYRGRSGGVPCATDIERCRDAPPEVSRGHSRRRHEPRPSVRWKNAMDGYGVSCAVLWRQWERPYARARNLMQRGLTEERAWRSACNQRVRDGMGGVAHERCFPEVLVRPSAAGVVARFGAAPLARFMNRRIRNRTYGRVGGRPR
jgi:hypothetical protein